MARKPFRDFVRFGGRPCVNTPNANNVLQGCLGQSENGVIRSDELDAQSVIDQRCNPLERQCTQFCNVGAIE